MDEYTDRCLMIIRAITVSPNLYRCKYRNRIPYNRLYNFQSIYHNKFLHMFLYNLRSCFDSLQRNLYNMMCDNCQHNYFRSHIRIPSGF